MLSQANSLPKTILRLIEGNPTPLY